ncbi:hypothetical protein [Myroides odoratimimus]|uniref:hypothetical protein n=1 Tax=Myroides odoratimimus TaxID=76832 RepID=UPI0004696700|nr:hypothetical protein [Myroides odoratimimus]
MLEYFILTFLCACIVWLYYGVLKDFLLSSFFFWGYRIFGQDEKNWKYFIYKLIWGCKPCTSGQLAFWTYLYFYFHSYNLVYHLGFIAVCVIINLILNDKLSKLQA